MNSDTLSHSPVLQKEVLAVLFFDEVGSVFDGTLGLGGHAESILQKFPTVSQYIACDLDSQHLSFAKKRLEKWEHKTELHHANFSCIASCIAKSNIKRPLVILLDLGLCSNHVDDPKKGFSFQANGPLNMAFDSENTQKKASDVLNTYSEQDLFQIIRDFGDEPQARKLAQQILKFRKEVSHFETTADLRAVVEKHIHPKDRNKTLMRVFQAIRIEVNQEMEHLNKTLKDALELMKKGDRIGVISYHALEDRMVKEYFTKACKPKTTETEFSLHTEIEPAQAKSLTKKPIVPSPEELLENPRSRSAKFRIIQKI